MCFYHSFFEAYWWRERIFCTHGCGCCNFNWEWRQVEHDWNKEGTCVGSFAILYLCAVFSLLHWWLYDVFLIEENLMETKNAKNGGPKILLHKGTIINKPKKLFNLVGYPITLYVCVHASVVGISVRNCCLPPFPGLMFKMTKRVEHCLEKRVT